MKEEGRGKKEEGNRDLRGYRRLVTWQKAHELATSVFRLLYGENRRLPASLVDQVFRSSLSVPTNITEGCTRGSLKEYLHFLDVARASLAEVDYQLYFMSDVGLLEKPRYAELTMQLDDTGNLLVALMRSLRRKLSEGDWQQLSEGRGVYTTESLLPPSSLLLPEGEG
jgi:four helix bundle protein